MQAFRFDSIEQSATPLPSTAASELCELSGALIAADEANAIAVLELAAKVGGADAAVFVWATPGHDEHVWFRSLAALDHRWGASVLRRLHEGSCNWLAHVARSSEPLLVRERADDNTDAIGSRVDPVDCRTIWVVPGPSPRSSDALGLLILGSSDDAGLAITRRLLPVYRSLALALSEWFQRQGREELVQRAYLTERDLELLRHESMGHGSKRIAVALQSEAKTIDCRFHRLNVRLGVANRRDAVRLCRRYGLL